MRIADALRAAGVGALLLAAPAASGADPTVEELVVDESDVELIERTAQDSLENAATYVTTEWSNPITGNRGTITPTQNFETQDGDLCRDYHQTVTIDDQPAEDYGTACRRGDGRWKIIAEVREEEPTEPEQPQVVYRERVVYVDELNVYEAPYGYSVLYPFATRVGIQHRGNRFFLANGGRGHPKLHPHRGGSTRTKPSGIRITP